MKKIIIKQLNTEKTHTLLEKGIYAFYVNKKSRKEDIKKEVEIIFGVKVVDVNILVRPKKEASFRGKTGLLSQYKKAYVKVANGMKIDFENFVKNS